MGSEQLDFRGNSGGRVVIITGAGNGLGKSHALLFASRGARVVVNDLGGKHDGTGKGSTAADAVVQEIIAKGGEAVANYDSVEDGAKIVQTAMDTWGRVDVIVNNAGILRDTSFQKLTADDWDLIYRVHVLGAFRTSHAAWNVTGGMRDKGYGRIIMTSSAAGIYGNFGQSNYSMAKLGVVGLMQTLAIEGRKRNILVNAIAPIAGSRMTETVLPANLVAALKPEFVSPLVVWLSHESCTESGGLFEVGGGFYAKLRWERAEGKTFKLGREISPEEIKKNFAAITSFEKTTHPTDITNSMAPILSNLDTQSRGGNDFIDVDVALSAPPIVAESKFDERDVALYALGVGAAENPLNAEDLSLVYEMNGGGFYTLPTFAVIPAMKVIFDGFKRGEKAPGMNYGFERVLHGEQFTEVKRPLPARGKLRHEVKCKDVYDKGKNAIVITSITSFDEKGEELAYNEVSTVVRGAGGWGGERGPSAEINVPPERAADMVVEEKTHDNQALLYRLSGDINPLHADPSFAQGFGFDKPILHGLCTYGFAARAVIKAFSKGDPRYFKNIKARFADSVFPGETLVTEMWKDSDTRVVFRTKVKERNKVVISNAAVELYKEIPTEKKAAPAAAGAAAGASAAPISADVFAGLKSYFESNADAVKKIGVVFQFKLTTPESLWTLDTKSATVSAGGATAPQCTLELSDADFMAMCTGKADPMKLFMDKKLRITGDVMASQKLEFLKKLDPATVVAAAKARASAVGSAPPTAPATPAAAGSISGDIFIAIEDYIEKNRADVTKIGVVYQFNLSAPESTWTVDLKAGKVTPGDSGKGQCTLALSDADFIAMSTGKADAMKLFMDKKLRITGDVMASQKLEFLKKIDPSAAAKAVAAKKAAAPAAATPVAAPAAAAKADAQAGKIFAALASRLQSDASIAAQVGGVLQWNVDGKSWTVDLGSSPGAVREGGDAKAAVVLTIADGDLAALVSGARSAQDLYQHGLLRVDGDVRLGRQLGFLKGLL